VTLGPPTEAFAQMIHSSHALASRAREIIDLREQALADTIAAETEPDAPQPRVVAAMLASVHRALFQYSVQLIVAGEPHGRIRETLATAAEAAFNLLEPSLGDYDTKP
jgi:hypothetical protein